MSRTSRATFASSLCFSSALACAAGTPIDDEVGFAEGVPSGGAEHDDDGLVDEGDATGDGEPNGDGEPAGDGDGEPNGDGEPDGDGDDDEPSGDGDGEPTGDGDQPIPCGPVCCPGQTSCAGETSQTCNDDGTAWVPGEHCDGFLGLVCNANTGICDGPCSAAKLGFGYIGCDYYPTVTLQYDDYNTAPKDFFAIAVANAGAQDAMVIITRGDTMILDTVIPANEVEVITLAWVNPLTKGNGPTAITVNGAYRLRSDRPLVVYQYNPLQSTTTNDASLLIPTNVWGRTTMVASWPHWSGIPGFYAVVAQDDDTTVTVSPPPGGTTVASGAGIGADGSGQVVLDDSDVLQVVSAKSGDLTGSKVVADKPVQVIGGHKCTNVPGHVAACDHLEEVLFPTQTLAGDYVVVPPAQVPNHKLAKAQMVRIIAVEDATSVKLTPDQGVDQVLHQAGDFIQLSLSTAAFEIHANKPLSVLQYMIGQTGGYGTSDPAMVQTVTPQQFRDDYLFFAAPSWTANFVDVVAPNGATVTVDGEAVNGWLPVPGSGFSYAHVQLSNAGDGTHRVSADSKVGISVYGVQNAGSYWYPGGLDLDIIPQ